MLTFCPSISDKILNARISMFKSTLDHYRASLTRRFSNYTFYHLKARGWLIIICYMSDSQQKYADSLLYNLRRYFIRFYNIKSSIKKKKLFFLIMKCKWLKYHKEIKKKINEMSIIIQWKRIIYHHDCM